jgi:hypothetical protein
VDVIMDCSMEFVIYRHYKDVTFVNRRIITVQYKFYIFVLIDDEEESIGVFLIEITFLVYKGGKIKLVIE